MPSEETLERIADSIDRLISIDFSGRGIIGKLYAHARAREGRSPTLVAAEKLKAALSEPGKVAVIITGFVCPYELRGMPCVVGETDGPPGAVALARILALSLRAIPVLVTEEVAVEAMSACARAAGLFVTDLESARKNSLEAKMGTTAVVLGFPMGDEAGKKAAREMVQRLQPAAVVVSEKMGPNERGVVVSSSGTKLNEQIRADFLIEEARRRGAPAIGVGDGGNEMGMILIKDGIYKDIPYGKESRFGGGPMPPAVETDVILPAIVSNWGTHAIGACLLAMLDRPELLYTEELEARVMERAAECGYIDASSNLCEPAADGLPLGVHTSFVKLLATVVRKGLTGWV
ncbi:MAG: glutamate cyclase domain-containing protein [Chloroflexota bacterium]